MIRPIWDMSAVIITTNEQQKSLLILEGLIGTTLKIYLDIARVFEVSTESNINSIESLIYTASVDLVAGCEMARCGYLKQAYTLWRS